MLETEDSKGRGEKEGGGGGAGQDRGGSMVEGYDDVLFGAPSGTRHKMCLRTCR